MGMTAAVQPITTSYGPSPSLPARGRVTTRRFAAWSVVLVMAALFSQIEIIGWIAVSLSAGLAFLTLLRWRRLSGLAFWLLLWLTVLAVLTVIAGSMPPLSELGSFLRGEGRTFLAFLPIVPFLAARLAPASARFVLRRGLLTGVAVLGAATVASMLPITRHFVVSPDGLLKVYSSSHHIPGYVGGLLVVVALSSPVIGLRLRGAAAVIGVAAVALASSRTSLVGLAVVLAYLGGRRLTAKRLLRSLVLGTILVVSVLSVDARARSMVSGFVGGDRVDDAAIAFQRGSGGVISSNDAAADVNIIKRFGVWGEASRSWLLSPVVGSGPFRLNDRQVERSVPLPGASIVTTGERVYSDFGAHNLLLQLAADGGLALLIPFVLMWTTAWTRAGRSQVATAGPTAKALIVFGWGVSLTSNALLSPAFVFPLSAFLGPLLAIGSDDGEGGIRAAQHPLRRP